MYDVAQNFIIVIYIYHNNSVMTRNMYIILCTYVGISAKVGLMYTHTYLYMYIQALNDFGEQLDLVYGLFMHEIIHALGFSSRLFDQLVFNMFT